MTDPQRPVPYLKPHTYAPSAMYAGDCSACGYTEKNAIHLTEPAAEPTPDLLPCAFCGAEGKYTNRPFGWRVECTERFVMCPMNARTHHHKEKTYAAANWNTRTLRVLTPETAAERDRLAAFNERVLKALEGVEWAGRDNFRCVECGGQPSTGHAENCRVRAALDEAAK